MNAMDRDIANVFGQQNQPPAPVFDQSAISIASPEKIRYWSYGEI